MLVPNGLAPAVATLEQMALQRDATPEHRAECAAVLLARCLHEARARGQACIVLLPLPSHLMIEGAAWTRAANFVPAKELAALPTEVARALAPGAVGTLVDSSADSEGLGPRLL